MTDQEAAIILGNWVDAFTTDGMYWTVEALERAIAALEREVAASLGAPGTAHSNTFIPRTM